MGGAGFANLANAGGTAVYVDSRNAGGAAGVPQFGYSTKLASLNALGLTSARSA